jgi:hypothetical protein
MADNYWSYNLTVVPILKSIEASVSMIQKTVQLFTNSFRERIIDQRTDIQSAGGIFSLAMRKGISELGTTFDDTLRFQKELNSSLAQAAAALPGSTGEYVQTAKMLTDGLVTTIGKDAENFKKIFGTEGGNIADAMKAALTEFTTKGVLLGQGQQGGIPLPVLLEQLVGSEKINVQSLGNRYVALRDNPLLKNALMDAEKAINKTGANTAQRLKLVMEALDEALPAEQINALKRSTEGILEAYRSFFFDPESGLLGLGRTLNFEVKDFSSSTGLATGGESAVGFFDLVNDIFANIAVVLSEGLPILMEIFDPLSVIGEFFIGLREESFNLFALFTKTKKYFETQSEKLGMEEEKYQTNQRAFLSSFTIWLRKMNLFTESETNYILKTLRTTKDLTKAFKAETLGKIWNRLMKSEFMLELGEAIGAGLAEMIKQIKLAVDVMAGTAGGATGPIAAMASAFSDAGGGKAFRDLIRMVIVGVINFAKNQFTAIMNENPGGVAIAGLTAVAIMNPQLMAGMIQKVMGPDLIGGLIGYIFGPSGLLGAIAQIGMKMGPLFAPLVAKSGALFAKLMGSQALGMLVKPLTMFLSTGVGQGLLGLGKWVAAFLGGPWVLAIVAVALLGFASKYLRDPIINFLRGIGNTLSSWAANQTGIWGVIVRNFVAIFQNLVDVINGVMRFLAGAWDFISGLLTGDWAKAWDGIKEMLGGLGDTFMGLVRTIIHMLLSPFRWILERMGILDKETRREVKKQERNYRRSHNNLMNSTFPTDAMNRQSDRNKWFNFGDSTGDGPQSGGPIVPIDVGEIINSPKIQEILGGRGVTPLEQVKGNYLRGDAGRAATANNLNKIPGFAQGDKTVYNAMSVAGTLGDALGAGISSSYRRSGTHHQWEKHGAAALDFGMGNGFVRNPKGIALFAALEQVYGPGGLNMIDQLLYNYYPYHYIGGQKRNGSYEPESAKGDPNAHWNHLHVSFRKPMAAYNGLHSALMDEVKNMPSGSRIAVANSSETIMTNEQIKSAFAGAAAGNGSKGVHIGAINVTATNGNVKEIAEKVVWEIEQAVNRSRLLSVYS